MECNFSSRLYQPFVFFCFIINRNVVYSVLGWRLFEITSVTFHLLLRCPSPSQGLQALASSIATLSTASARSRFDSSTVAWTSHVHVDWSSGTQQRLHRTARDSLTISSHSPLLRILVSFFFNATLFLIIMWFANNALNCTHSLSLLIYSIHICTRAQQSPIEFISASAQYQRRTIV